MTASTQRLTITQDWQQVATGNVTLIGCNTAANYHIYVGADTPTAKSAFVTDKLNDGKEFNYNAPVWVKLDVNNQIDEADLIVMGEAVVPAGATATTTPTSPLVFTKLVNAVYQDGKLQYTSGTLGSGDGEAMGYTATIANPTYFKFKANQSPDIRLDFGDNDSSWLENPTNYNPDANLEVIFVNGNCYIAYPQSSGRGNVTGALAYSIEDEISVTIDADYIRLKNETLGQQYLIPQIAFTNPPKYAVITSFNNNYALTVS